MRNDAISVCSLFQKRASYPTWFVLLAGACVVFPIYQVPELALLGLLVEDVAEFVVLFFSVSGGGAPAFGGSGAVFLAVPFWH